MFRPRIIPVLLLSKGGAVKTKQFGSPVYLGDIINTARIFSEFKADELLVLDIDASREKRCIAPELVKEISNETGMPLTVGGGIRTLPEIEVLLRSGAEKVVLGSIAQEDQEFIRRASSKFGSSAISVCIDYDAALQVRYRNGQLKSLTSLEHTIKRMEELGAGELIIQSIENDGMRSGYDFETIMLASEISKIPVVALGGARSLTDLSKAYFDFNCSACAASSLFVFHRSGVLISYPEKSEISNLFTK